MSRNISIYTNDIDVFFEELSDNDLKDELLDRKANLDYHFEDSKELLQHLKRCLGLQDWHDKERVIKEINDLII
jgi:hypothetical protein